MDAVKLNLDEAGYGVFTISEGTEQLGEMAVSISPGKLTVYHTEVSPKAEGKGLAKEMLESMVSYAREHRLKVDPLCPYVHAQFMRHPETYADVWNHKT